MKDQELYQGLVESLRSDGAKRIRVVGTRIVGGYACPVVRATFPAGRFEAVQEDGIGYKELKWVEVKR